ncbi:putative leucine-rich repeat-containing protein DDB_G0290503 isoform X2 [Acyrthosiphon pisum]|uniref:LisH domain-containing protein n=1 Tax=Acyrthosiphon pisum TaxID=7029 RepID=A0A8R2JUA6_ACYPI|nr:putative leucine-rich repeat-containing protein DDB_G0290503 isoform X2 [Acyrthosiphon pisum]
MEPLMPSEVARLVYGYLKKEKNEDAAVCFLKSSPHLTECFQMFKANRNFNIKVNGFDLHDIFDNFGTMCTMIEKRIPETCESKTLIEKLQYLLDTNHIPTEKDKFVEKKLNMVDKCVGNTVNTKDQSTHTTINIEANKSISEELLEVPSFTEIISNNISKTKEPDTFNDETTITNEKNSVTFSSPCLSPMTQLENNTGTISKFEEKESKIFQINKQICSTPAKKNEQTKIKIELIPQFSPKNSHNLNSGVQAENHQIPEATSLDSMPGFSKEDRIKDGSIVIDTGELVDTFLNDQSLLEKIADTINKSFDAQKETDNILESKVLDPPTLEKALDSTQSDPQIKNILDEFLVFNVDNDDIGKKTCTNDQLDDSIKSRLRSARKKDDVPSKLKKNNFNIPKHIVYGNEECLKVDNNIVLIHEGEGYFAKSDYVKIAPKITPMLKTNQASEKHIFPKRRRQLLEVPCIRSKFRRTNITRQPSVQTPKSIVIEVPNQNSFEIQEKNHTEINDVIKLPEVSSKVNNVIVHDTPDDRLKPPKNKSMSTPRRRSTHIRCLDFSTPQPKNMTKNQARSKLFCDSPNRLEKCLEEPSSSPLPKLQVDWGSVNGFESMVKKEIIKDWDTDIREMVGAGILTSDADGRKTRKKKTPRKKIKSVNIQNDSVLLKDQKKSSNISIATNELHTDVSNISDITYNGLNEQDSNKPLLDVQKPLLEKNTKCPPSLETSNNVTELNNEQPPIKSNSLNTLNNLKLLKKDSEFSISLETPDKITELYNEQLPTISDSLKNINDKKSLIKQSEFSISLETPDKTIELYTKQPSVKFDSLNNDNNKKSFNKQSEFMISLETPDKKTELNNKQLSIKSDSSKSECATQINLEQSHVNEQKNNQNKLINSSILNTIPEITNQEKDSNFLKRFNNHNYSLIENKSNEPTKPLKDQGLFVQTDNNNSSELNSPLKCISIESFKPNLVETPYKCDDAAVDVPETPISKIIREYDPSKMVTPLPCTPEHDESLTETPLTKVFRETSYLNRPPISPFPPTPGNSMSVDTLIIPPEQDHFKTSNNINCKINSLKELSTQPIQSTTTNRELSTKSKKDKVKCTPSKSKLKVSTKSKVKNGLKINNIEEKKKQVYESVKVELFGSDISVSPYKPEILKTNEQHKSIVINKKPKEEEKKSGFKPIPKRKSIESISVVNVNSIEEHSSDELNMQPTNTPLKYSIKPIIVQCENNTSGKAKKTISKKINKSMVHFDDPVETFFSLSKSPTLDKSNNKKISKIKCKTTVNDNSEQLIGLSRYLNKTSSTDYDCSPKKKKIKTIEPTVNISKLNNSDSNINYSEMYNEGKSSKNISTSDISNETKTNDMNNKKIKLSANCIIDVNKVYNEKENVKQTVSLDDTPNCILENKMNTSLERSESPIVVKSSVNNTSFISFTHDDKLDVQISKVCDSLSNMKYLKKQKVYEVITDDGEHVMVKLNVSEIFTLLDIVSELDPIASPSITTNKMLDVTPKIESGELDNDEKILMPVTSTPKDNVETKIEKDDRGRRSPSFWDDSVHNYPIKHRDNRYREKNRWQNKIHNKYDYKHRSSKFRCHDERFDSPIHHSQRSHHQNVKREFTEDSVKDIHRYKYKNEHRRSYHDYYSKGRKCQEENERFSIPQRMSQNELPKSNRSEDIVKKATKRPSDRTVYNKTPSKVSKVEHQRLLKNVDVDDFLSVVHGQK